MIFKESFIIRDLDKSLAILGIFFSLILIVYLGIVIGRVIYLLTGVLALLSCLLWLVIRNNHPFDYQIPTSPTTTRLLAVGFFGFYILSVLSLSLRVNLYERPFVFFILMAIMAGIIACEIITADGIYSGIIIFQILVLGSTIAWSQLFIFPSLLGIDPWYHFALTTDILVNGNIPDGYVYSKLPLFHLLISLTSLVGDLPYKVAAILSVSFAQILCNATFVSLIAYRLFNHIRVGLLAGLLVIIANYHIFMSYWSIPNAFAAIFIPIILYLAFFKFRGNSSVSSIILYALLFSSIILTHTVTSVCMGILLIVIWGAPILYRTIRSNHGSYGSYVSLITPVVFILAMFAWWAYASRTIEPLSNFISWGFSADVFVQTQDIFKNYAAVIPDWEQIINMLGMFLFFALSFIGIFYMISKNGNDLTFIMALVAISPLAISYFTLISGLSVLEQRWWYYAQILLSIPLAVTIYATGTWKIRNFNLLHCFVFLFVFFLSFLMVISPTANVDNHSLSPITGSTTAYTQSELAASDFFAKNTLGLLASDSNYSTNPSSSIFMNYYRISSARLLTLDYSLIVSDYNYDGSVKIIRKRFLSEPLKTGGLVFQLRPDLEEHISSVGFSKIYQNPAMTGYTD